MTLFFFTTTGNSLTVARAIGGTIMSIPGILHGKQREFADDTIGIVPPVYFGDLPGPVRQFIESVTLHSDYTFLIFTCGTTPACASLKAMRSAGKAGTRFDYIDAIRMVDNYFPMFDVAKQVADLPSKHVDDNLNRICTDIAEKRHSLLRPTLFGRIADAYMKLFPLSSEAYRRFRIEKAKCNPCGTCVKVCPIGNINITDSHSTPEIWERCLTCGACYHNCPSGAIRYKGEKSTYQFRNPAVSLADIIQANDRTRR